MLKRKRVKVACLTLIALTLQSFQPLVLASVSDSMPLRAFLKGSKGNVQYAPESEIEKPQIPSDLFIKKPSEENPYRAGITKDRSVGIFTKNLIIYQENPEEIILPVIVANMAQVKNAKLLGIQVVESSAIIRARLDNINIPLTSIADLAATPDMVLSILISNEGLQKREIFEKGFFRPISLNFKGSHLRVGDSVTLITKANVLVDGEQAELSTQTAITVASLPLVPAGWYLGDAHLHSNFSNPGDYVPYSIHDRAVQALNKGLSWIVMTDHSDGIQSNGMSNYISTINSEQAEHSIPIGPGAEITSVSVHGDPNSISQGDALEYWVDDISPYRLPPTNKYWTGSELIYQIWHNNDYDTGFYPFPAIAHPNGNPSWTNWSNTSWQVIEVLSGSISIDWNAVDTWRSYNRTYKDAIANNAYPMYVMVSNSDAHFDASPGQYGGSWIYAPDYASERRWPIWNALFWGRVSASDGYQYGHSFASMEINGYPQGSIIHVPQYSTLNFKIKTAPLSGLTVKRVQIYGGDWTEWKRWDNPPAGDLTFSMIGPGNNWFYFAVATFANMNGQEVNQVVSNAIFVSAYPTSNLAFDDYARSLSGDVDGDGYAESVALYDYGGATTKIWALFTSGGNQVWWASQPGYFDATKCKSIVGDFNGDGKDDLAVLYNYGGSTIKIWLFFSNGSGFSAPAEAFYSTGWSWDASKVVAGDFTGDGKDDIGILYNYGGTTSALWVFPSTGSSLAYPQRWFYSSNWSWSSSKIIAGNMNGDTYGNNPAYPIDDVMIAYNYGGARTAWHQFTSTRSSFSYSGIWYDSGENNWEWVNSKFAPVDLNWDGKTDIATLYNRGGGKSDIFAFISSGGGFSSIGVWWSGYRDWGRTTVLGGRFNTAGDVMLITGYNNAQTTATLHQSRRSSFWLPIDWWDSGAGNWDYLKSKLY